MPAKATKPEAKVDAPCTAALDPAYYAYVLEHTGETEIQKKLRGQGEKMELPNYMASPDEYQFLAWLCETIGAKRVLEVGVFRGVTTLAIAQRLPKDGMIKALDISADFAEIGIKAWKEAGVADKIDFVVGPAAASMQRFIDAGEGGSYDFVFIDANKDEYPQYYELAVQLLRSGGVIAVDNTVFHGRVVDAAHKDDPTVAPIVALNNTIKGDSRVSAVMTSMADGIYFARKL